MKRFLSALMLLLLLPVFGNAAGFLSGLFSESKTVGADIAFEDITDFYYTYSTSVNPPYYQRYRFYTEGARYYFFHETREGGGWPQTEADITAAGTLELTEKQWSAFCDLLYGGTADRRREALSDGNPGPWLYIYWAGGEADGREFRFVSRAVEAEFEAFCAGLKEPGSPAAGAKSAPEMRLPL